MPENQLYHNGYGATSFAQQQTQQQCIIISNMTAQTTIPRAERAGLPFWRRITRALVLILAILGLGLALIIPLTMPTMLLMQARIGATELSLWLLVLNVI